MANSRMKGSDLGGGGGRHGRKQEIEWAQYLDNGYLWMEPSSSELRGGGGYIELSDRMCISPDLKGIN